MSPTPRGPCSSGSPPLPGRRGSRRVEARAALRVRACSPPGSAGRCRGCCARSRRRSCRLLCEPRLGLLADLLDVEELRHALLLVPTQREPNRPALVEHPTDIERLASEEDGSGTVEGGQVVAESLGLSVEVGVLLSERIHSVGKLVAERRNGVAVCVLHLVSPRGVRDDSPRGYRTEALFASSVNGQGPHHDRGVPASCR